MKIVLLKAQICLMSFQSCTQIFGIHKHSYMLRDGTLSERYLVIIKHSYMLRDETLSERYLVIIKHSYMLRGGTLSERGATVAEW